MKRVFQYTVLCLVFALFSCVREEEPVESSYREGEEVCWAIPFGAAANDEFEINTKATLSLEKETKVWNLYIFVFEGGGTKIYSHFFDETNLDAETGSDWWHVDNSDHTTGTIYIHTVSRAGSKVYGIANIDADMVNISPELLSTVQNHTDLQNLVATLNQNITSRNGYFPMTGTIVDRNTGNQQTVNPGEDLHGTNYVLRLKRLDAKIIFKVRVASPNEDREGNVMTASNYSTLHPDCSSLAEAIDKYGCRIGGFTPGKWQVINVPKKSYVIENGGYSETSRSNKLKNASTTAADFFNSVPTNFDAAIRQDSHPTYSGSSQNEIYIHPFSFYMMENRQKSSKSSGWTYQDREKQSKTSLGNGVYENGSFVYAPALSTYVVFTGRIEMDNITYHDTQTNTDFEGATLNGEPTYTVHLGDFSSQYATSGLGNFDVFRNHTYTYNIVIFDVGDIRTEVEINYDDSIPDKTQENEPGAEGRVTVSLEEIYTSDCHYSSHVITFHAKNIKADNVTWYVKTPFNPDGKKPLRVADENGELHDVTSGLDYEWVEFRVNEQHVNPSTGTFAYWENERQIYKPRTGEYADGKTMNVSELVSYLRNQKLRWDRRNEGVASDFDDGTLPGGGTDPNGEKICVTAFVNEYYYERDPRDGSYTRDLWKKSINQPMREMHILSDTKESADQDSQEIGASFTIQQFSIQSVYNMDNPDLMSAWGSEHFDDPLESYNGSGESRYYSKNNTINAGQKRGNTSMTNGRNNTAIEWGMTGTYRDYPGSPTGFGVADWSTYLNLTANNETPLMNTEYQALRYSCMSRNRDNNGNGKIDQDELRWYMGATNQLYGLYLGDYGIEGSAKLYQRNATEQASAAPAWNQHVLSSTMNAESGSSDGKAVAGTGNNGPRCIWAEEGVTGSDMARSAQYNEKVTTFTTRCLRNLGYDPNSTEVVESRKDFTFSPLDHEPQNYVQVTRRKKNNGANISYPTGTYANDVFYDFDCTLLNKASRRYYSSMELDCTDEFAEAAMLPDYLRMAALGDQPIATNRYSVSEMNEYLNEHIGQNPYCPPGFRVPNIRELVLIRYFLPVVSGSTTDENNIYTNNSNDMALARTYWSFGIMGSYKRGSSDANVWGWGVNRQKMQMAHKTNQYSTKIRCVKDINPNDPEDMAGY